MSKKMIILLFAVIICLSLARLFFTGQNRGLWIYKDIYEIHGTEKTEAVAVQINDRYYIAKRQ